VDIWTILSYVLGIVFNISIVGIARNKAYQAGVNWLTQSRWAVVAIFILCALELLVTGGFTALQDAQAFVKLLNEAWIMAGACFGGHTALKTVSGR